MIETGDIFFMCKSRQRLHRFLWLNYIVCRIYLLELFSKKSKSEAVVT